MLQKNKILAGLAAVAFAFTLAGCSSGGETKTDTGPKTDNGGGQIATTPYTPPATTSSGTDLSAHSVYFDFDKSDIKPESVGVISNWATYLSANPTSKVRLEGNTDERGTREYNIGLGERRANAVAQALEAKGVSASQLTTVSYGKERPVALGHDEASWQQNRRVDLVQQ
ncbi:MAG: peptidoglycan-associated lipoprotein Pal [Nevskia sp.]|nr:peptidoglycan-associated lipoprotein Pal [Nevskia sp.]